MSAVDYVAEHVLGYRRGACSPDHKNATVNVSTNGTESTYEFRAYCRWCGEKLRPDNGGPCPSFPFPAFTLVDLMQRLGEVGVSVWLCNEDDPDKGDKFTLVIRTWHELSAILHCDYPLETLCQFLATNRARIDNGKLILAKRSSR